MTDANLVLGRLNPGYFLGGEMDLDVEGARERSRSAARGRSASTSSTAAHGIVEIANAAMVNALRLVSVQRGYDPRDFVLVGFGGAGPVHANALARDAEMPTLLIPPSPGIFSAIGLLMTDLKRDAAITVMRAARRRSTRREVESVFAGLEARRARRSSRREGVAADRDRVRPPDRHALRRPELRADDSRRRSGCSSGSTPSTTARTASPRRRSRSSS